MNQEDRSFPNEPTDYRARREELRRAEADLRDQVERVAALRRELPLGGRVPEDYVFERIMDFAVARGWSRVPLLSSSKNSYNTYYWGEDAEEHQMPMLNVFVERDDGVYHSWGSELLYAASEGQPRHVDLLWALWNILDLTPEGRGTDWYPKLEYA